jgi:hypothetical protein
MATRAKKISVTVTAGENTPVNHVVRLEDLLHRLQQPAKPQKAQKGQKAQKAGPAKKAAAASAPAAEPGPAQQAAAALEAQLRALRKRQP